MPPRAAKKTPAKKPFAKSKNPASTPESSPINASNSVAEETTPQTETLSTIPDTNPSVADEVAVDAPTDVPADPIVDDSIAQSESEQPLADANVVLEVDEGAKVTFDKVYTTNDVEYEAAGDVEGIDGDEDNNNDVDVDNEENEDSDLSLDMRAPIAEGKKQKESEIFVGGLDKEAVEDDLIKVFGVFGDVQSARIVRNPTTKKSKGFAFIRFANSEHTMKALTDLKDGTEIKGKHVRIQASQDNATLHLGNISKTWTRDNVIKRLKSLGVEQFDNMILPSDPKNEEKIKGFAFLEFNSHSDAILAFQRLRKSDAYFGRDMTVNVAFAHATLHPSEDDMLQVKTVHFDGIPPSWDDEKVKELCKEYGQIERVLLSRNFSSRKRKDFGFVEFSSRESALACLEGINKAEIVNGDAKVVAGLARPMNKGRVVKQGFKGGFKIKNYGETIQEAGGIGKKRKASGEIWLEEKKHNKKIAEVSTPSTSHMRDSKGKRTLLATFSDKRRNNIGNVKDTYGSGRSSKKMLQNGSYGKARDKRTYSAVHARTLAYPARYATPSTAYEGYAYAGTSEPQIHPSDLVPHAGYIPAQKQGTSTYAYDQRRTGTYNGEPWNNFESGRAISGVPTYHPDYSNYEAAAYRHHNTAPRGPYYY